MDVALQVFIGSVVLFTAFSFVVQMEERKGNRMFLVKARSWLDRILYLSANRLHTAFEHFLHHVVKLGWYYSIHSFLRAIMALLVSAYDYLETHFEKNRIKTRILRASGRSKNSHFTAVADHKDHITLTPDEEIAFKDKKLEDLH